MPKAHGVIGSHSFLRISLLTISEELTNRKRLRELTSHAPREEFPISNLGPSLRQFIFTKINIPTEINQTLKINKKKKYKLTNKCR